MMRIAYKTGVAIYKHLPESVQEIIWTRVKSRTVADRRYLEEVILPALAARQPQRVLFVGVRRYTRHYAAIFERGGAEYWTLELDPKLAKFGSRHHVVGNVLDSARLFQPEFFDIVLLNGVFGWGVDRTEDQEAALRALRAVMKPGGVLLLGYNRDRVRDPLELETIRRDFTHGIPGLPPRMTFSTESHVFDLFEATRQDSPVRGGAA